jgi:hypothetical protein
MPTVGRTSWSGIRIIQQHADGAVLKRVEPLRVSGVDELEMLEALAQTAFP